MPMFNGQGRQMFAVDVMVPCIAGARCQLDWSAIAALGGWAAAVMTFFAVLLPFTQYRRAERARDAADFVEGQVAIRGALIVLMHIHTGIGAIASRVASASGIDDFTESLEFVRTYLVPSSLPALPRVPAFGLLRIEIAGLEASLQNLSAYITTSEMGAFDAEIAEAYVVAVDNACSAFNRVVAELDAASPGFEFHTVLVPFDLD